MRKKRLTANRAWRRAECNSLSGLAKQLGHSYYPVKLENLLAVSPDGYYGYDSPIGLDWSNG